MILSYKQTTSKCAHCGRSITLDGVWPRPFKALGFWYHDDFVDVDCSGYSCDDGEGNEAEPNDC